ncbi:MAG: transmembrane domain-containing protein [Candidatus Pacearchaeota archaeon]|jgi:hypothetical protein
MGDKKNHKYMIIIGILGAVAIIALGFFLFSDHLSHNYQNVQMRNGIRRPGNFTINQTKVDQTTSFFQGSPSADQVSTYCSQNRIYCFSYCRKNQTDESCAGLFNYTRNYETYSMMNWSGQGAQ